MERPTLQQLGYLVAVDDHRHFGRAAEACFVSQPALSAQIRELERRLGVTLFERGNRRGPAHRRRCHRDRPGPGRTAGHGRARRRRPPRPHRATGAPGPGGDSHHGPLSAARAAPCRHRRPPRRRVAPPRIEDVGDPAAAARGRTRPRAAGPAGGWARIWSRSLWPRTPSSWPCPRTTGWPAPIRWPCGWWPNSR